MKNRFVGREIPVSNRDSANLFSIGLHGVRAVALECFIARPDPESWENCICFPGPSGSPWAFRDGTRAMSVPVSGNLEFNQAAAAAEACADGLGFGRFIHYQVAPYVATKRLRVVLEDFEVAPLPLSIVYPHARLLPSRTRVFVEWLKTELGSALSSRPARSRR